MTPDNSQPPAPRPAGSLAFLLTSLPWLMALASLAAVILVYPLRVNERWVGPMFQAWKDQAATSWLAYLKLNQFEAILSFFFSPLILKGALAAVGALLTMALWASGRVLFIPSTAEPPKPLRERLAESFRWPFWILFIAWSAVSVAWSPTPGASNQALMWLVVYGAFGYWLLHRGVSRAETRQLAVAMTLLGALVAVITLLEATRAFNGAIFKFMMSFDEPRNAFGSLMGHNTAVASFLMMTGFPALALALEPRGRFSRALLWIYIAVALWAMLLVQSRAVWALGPVLALLFLRWMARGRGWRMPWRVVAYVVSFIALGLATQTVKTPRNPFYLEKSPVLQRFRDLRPWTMLEGTRARMIFPSLDLVKAKPVLGHGLHTFSAVFPEAQAKYFARNPDTRLRPTVKRSHMAHNEYLQALVETGVIGLGLALAALGQIIRRGRRAGRELDPADRTLRMAFGFAALGMAAHALSDFPFHIPQLVFPWFFCLAAFASPRPERERSADGAPTILDSGGSSAGPRTLRLGHVARLTLAMILPMLVPFASFPFVRAYQADIDSMYGEAYWQLVSKYKSQLTPADYERYAQFAQNAWRRTLILEPADDSTRLQLGQLYGHLALGLIQREKAQPEGVPRLHAPARALLEAARELIVQSMGSLDYHGSYYALAGVDHAFASITPPERRKAHIEDYRRNLEKTIYYSPAMVDAMYALDRLIPESGASAQNLERRLILRKTIRKQSPPHFHDWYYVPADEAMRMRDYDRALAAAGELLQVDPNDPFYLLFALEANMRAGRRPEAVQLMKRLETLQVDRKKFPVHPYYFSFARVYLPMMQGKWDEVLNNLDTLSPEVPETRAILAAFETYGRERLGMTGMPSRYPPPEGMSPEGWAGMAAEGRAFTYFRLIRDLPRARAAFTERAAMAGSPPTVEFWIESAYLALEMGDRITYADAIQNAERLDARHPVVLKLKALARPTDAGPEGAPISGPAATAP